MQYGARGGTGGLGRLFHLGPPPAYRQSDIVFTDTWVALAAIAARTERLRLGPVITALAPRRPLRDRPIS
jgi:alkanesulfonate monooxygenase SsuD/methylene tetrahydromethanopterin reductase-like flavin-dependent oxidoreductase (luciferase family)